MQHGTGTFTGLNATEIFTQHWLPDGPPRAVIVLVHGYAEYSGRYAHVAAHLTAHNFAVYALDHRGHGRSGGLRVMVRDFEEYCADLRTYVDSIRTHHPDVPLFLYGHSMGSLISLLFAFRWQDELSGLITSGTALHLGGTNALLLPFVRMLSWWTPRASLIPPLDAAGISRDPEVVARYTNDPLVYRGSMRIGLVTALLRASQTCIDRLPELRLPYLALHGGADPLTLPSSARVIQERSGSPDTTVKIYDGLYHELHNEPEHDRVLADVTAWLEAHLNSEK